MNDGLNNNLSSSLLLIKNGKILMLEIVTHILCLTYSPLIYHNIYLQLTYDQTRLYSLCNSLS